jgi:hypothetical protein
MQVWTKRIAGLRRRAMSTAGVVVLVLVGIVLIFWAHPPRTPAPSPSEPVNASEQAKALEEAMKRASEAMERAFEAERRRHTQQQSNILSEVDAIRATLERASIAFNVPTPIRHDSLVEVQLLLSVRKGLLQLSQEVEGYGLREAAEVRVSRRVRAELTGSGFDIKATSPLEQAIPSDDDVQWKWDIKAITPEPRAVLHLSLSSLASVDGATTPAWHRSFDRWIEIEITAQQRLEQFVEKNWQWLWAAILVPLAGWGLRFLGTLKARASADQNAGRGANAPAPSATSTARQDSDNSTARPAGP